MQELLDEIEVGLQNLHFPTEPAVLYEPVRYLLAGGGKRIRPLLLLLSGQLFGKTAKELLPAALAVEVFHNFTLAHDDIMDHAPSRRNRATVHVKWSEATAILAGDFMMGFSYELLAQVPTPNLAQIIHTFHQMVIGLCEGQALDDDFPHRSHVTVADYLQMISGKTGALVECCFLLGGMYGNATQTQLAALQQVGFHLGRGFQIQDDYLDLVATDEKWGKQPAGDLLEGKKAYPLLFSLELAKGDDLTYFHRILTNKGCAPADIPNVLAKMEQIGVLTHTQNLFLEHYEKSLSCLLELPNTPARKAIQDLISNLMERKY